MGRGLLAIPKILGDVESRWRNEVRPRYLRTVAQWEAETETTDDLSADELLSGVETVMREAIEYYNSSRFVLMRVRQSEALFTTYYDRVVRRPSDPPAQIFLRGFESEPIRAEKALYDLARWCRDHPALADVLSTARGSDAAKLLGETDPPAGVSTKVWTEWQRRFQTYLDEYGHAIYSLDFLTPVPATDPSVPFETLTSYLDADLPSPEERQRQLAEQRQQATEQICDRLGPIQRPLFRRLLTQAQAVAPLREDILAEVGSGWPVLQRMAQELGRRLVATGAIERADDIYWLEQEEFDELVEAIDAGATALADVSELVQERKATWQERKRLNPPALLLGTIRVLNFEIDTKRWQGGAADGPANVITGVGTSPGRVTGRACVILDPRDFGRFRTGDVLVARITAPALTPLFTKSSGIVTDIGGPLSHGSIVAREYAIPAVLGTSVATDRIRDGQRIRVDGDAGTVTILDSGG